MSIPVLPRPTPDGSAAPVPHPADPNATAAAVLRALAGRAEHPPATYLGVCGDLESTVRQRSRRSGLTVVGTHLSRGADHDRCPVLVYGPLPAPTAGPVLLAVDDDGNAGALVAFAAAEAARRCAPLRAVHVWTEAPSDCIGHADRLLADLLFEYPPGPRVVAERQIMHDPEPAQALAGLSRTAVLLVVAARSSAPSGDDLLGATVTGLLGRTCCPLAVLPQQVAP